jgi:hypothetical protein
MALSDVDIAVIDGALALAATNPDQIQAKIGVSSLGTANTVYPLSNPRGAKTVLGAGPLVESVGDFLTASGGPVLAVPVAASNPGTVGAITVNGTSPSPGVGTSGTPRDVYDVIVKIVAGGAVATASFKVSWDGGQTWSPVYATAASITAFVAFSGLTLTFAAGTYVADDTYTFTTKAPTFGASDVGAAMDALKAYVKPVSILHVVGTVGGVDDAAKITAMAALIAAIQSKAESMADSKRWLRVIVELPEVTETAWAASAVWQSVVAPRVSPVGGRETIVSEISDRQVTLSFASAYSARLALIPVQEAPGKFARGPLKNVLSITHDERANEVFEDARITSSRTFTDVPGFFTTRGMMLHSAGSDFTTIQRARLIDKACRELYRALLIYLEEEITVSAETGLILDEEAQTIELNLTERLKTALVESRNASAVSVTVDRTNNILSTEELKVSFRVIPKANARFVSGEVGLLNPAITQVA